MPTAAGVASNIESAKKSAATAAVRDHFPQKAKYVGIGSGSTVVHVVNAIVALDSPHIKDISFIPTGYQSRQVILKAGLKEISFDTLPQGAWIDVAFDGADEVDEELNCIKGGGACLYQEKLVAMRARKFICVADHRKLKPRLLTAWPTIPIEVEPLSAQTVLSELRDFGSPSPFIRNAAATPAAGQTGPVRTDQDNLIIDAPFPKPLLLKSEGKQQTTTTTTENEGGGEGVWEVEALAKTIKAITGVLDVGLFCGVNGREAEKLGKARGGMKPMAAYFGMEDGRVMRRVAREDGKVEELLE